jgi:hypothetical protein
MRTISMMMMMMCAFSVQRCGPTEADEECSGENITGDHEEGGDDEEEKALAEFERRMVYAIATRHNQAHSERTGNLRIMSGKAAAWFRARSPEDIWLVVQRHTTRTRRLIIGGIFLGLCNFTDLPKRTVNEVKKWLIYGDWVVDKNLEMLYVGSGTARSRFTMMTGR